MGWVVLPTRLFWLQIAENSSVLVYLQREVTEKGGTEMGPTDFRTGIEH